MINMYITYLAAFCSLIYILLYIFKPKMDKVILEEQLKQQKIIDDINLRHQLETENKRKKEEYTRERLANKEVNFKRDTELVEYFKTLPNYRHRATPLQIENKGKIIGYFAHDATIFNNEYLYEEVTKSFHAKYSNLFYDAIHRYNIYQGNNLYIYLDENGYIAIWVKDNNMDCNTLENIIYNK